MQNADDEMALVVCLWVSAALPTPSTSTSLSPGLTAASLNSVSESSKELRLGGRIGATSKGAVGKPVILKKQQVDPITHFKHLWKILDNKRTFKTNIDYTEFLKKTQAAAVSPQEKEALQHWKPILTTVMFRMGFLSVLLWYESAKNNIKQSSKSLLDNQLHL